MNVIVDVQGSTTAELVAFYNANSGKPPIKKFQDRATAEKRVLALLAEHSPAPPEAPKKERRKTEDGLPTARAVKPEKKPSKTAAFKALLAEGRCPHCAAGTEHQTKAGRSGEPLHSTHRTCDSCGVTYAVASGRALKGVPERSVAIASSWSNAETAAKRAQRDGVVVDGKPYRSVRQAFEELGLQLTKHIKFRMELKQKGHATFEGHKFKIAPQQ